MRKGMPVGIPFSSENLISRLAPRNLPLDPGLVVSVEM
jgi:hypothetical protein